MADIKIGLIGGSGLGEAVGTEQGERHDIDTPFGKPSGPIITTEWEGVEIAMLQRHGEGHIYSPTTVPYRANIYALKALGVTHVLASGATGSLREEFQPRDLVVADQIIDKTHKRANTFYENNAVHVEFAEPFCPVMREWLLQAVMRPSDTLEDMTLHDGGTYVCMEGPAFSTRAESHMHRSWGGDLIGMTAMPEAKLAREAELAYAMLALPTDYDCWRPHDPNTTSQQLLEEIVGNLHAATANAVSLIRLALSDVTMLRDQPSPTHEALTMGIWTNKSKIPADEVERLRVLWGRHFDQSTYPT